MDGGDISNEASPRLVFVWEGLLAQLPADAAPLEARLLKKKKWTRALDLWSESEHMRHVLMDLTWRSHVSVDILCMHPRGFATVLRARLDEEGYPYGNLYNFGLMAFDRELAYMPNVQRVFHAFGRMPFLFGSRGQLIRPTDRVII